MGGLGTGYEGELRRPELTILATVRQIVSLLLLNPQD